MSTRRARIKAVTSLPPRRKNLDNGGPTKKNVLASGNEEKAVRSPRTPRSISKIIDLTETQSPSARVASPLKSPRNVAKTPNNSKISSPLKPGSTESQKSRQTPVLAEKVPVITSTAAFRHSMFISPHSPATRIPATPVIKTHRKLPEENVQRVLTPIKVNEVQKKVVEELIISIVGDNDTQKLKTDEPSSSETSKISKTDVPDVDYNVPSVPESLTEDTVMDGIIPLHSAASVHNPVALLKDKIISDHAEVLFDPIVPLPSPTKVRPKLRPAPRFPPRRNSIQGSASESEDESRRALLGSGATTPAPLARQRHDSQTSLSTLHSAPNREVNRTRNDSVCSSASQTTVQPLSALSPVKEKQQTRNRRQDNARRNAAMRRRIENAKRDPLTMYDLIFYNPTTKPFIPDQEELEAQEANEKDSKVTEENADDPPPSDAPPVPQVKIGPNGEIVLDEKSLVINRSSNRKVTSVVREGAWTGSKGAYRRSKRSAEWADAETIRFYRALAAIGTDFTLMESLFPGRTRRDLKLKFKKEEKINCGQVDKALRTGAQWDATRLQREFDDERKLAAEQEKRRKETERRLRQERANAAQEARSRALRTSRGTKILDFTSIPDSNHNRSEEGTADSLIKRVLEAKQTKKRKIRPRDLTPTLATTNSVDSDFATLTLINNSPKRVLPSPNLEQAKHLHLQLAPANIETGSLVVLSVNDPNSPSKKMLQTYIAHEAGRLTPVNLPSSLLNSVVGYMKKGIHSTGSMSPSSVASQDSRTSSTPVNLRGTPEKRVRRSSFTISQL